jgi:HD-GYP domain-containing protein (c-di-GMP phosphodiesterase class II)
MDRSDKNMGKDDSDKFSFNKQSSRASLKASIQKRLLIRLGVAAVLISIVLTSAVFFIEIHRLGGLVNGRASLIAIRFNDEIRHLLDGSMLMEQPALQNKLKMLSIAGKLDLGLGHLIYAGIYDLNGKEIVMEKDAHYAYLNAVDDFMKSLGHRLPSDSKKVYKLKYIKGNPHILLTFPLTNSKNEQVAVIEGVFAVSSKARDEVVWRIVRTAFEAVGIVVLTTLIFYPIIITLIGRLSNLADNLLESNIEALRVLGSAIAKRDSDTDIHNYRVTIYAVTLAEAVGLKRSLIRGLIKGAFLHDVGKIGISDRILLKPGKLTKSEFEIMKHHVNHGIDIVERSDWLKDSTDVVGYHHEQFDGRGYPYGLNGENIPINARTFAIADVFDALTSIRPYKSPIPFDDAMKILAKGRGSHFDPSLIDTFTTIAKSLYDRVANFSDQTLREELESITRQYFSKEM